MAFNIPQFYSNYNTYPVDLTAEFPTPGVAAVYGNNTSVMDNTILWGQDNNNNNFTTPVHDNNDNGALLLDHNNNVPQDNWDSTISKAWMSTFSEQLGSVPECKMGFYSGAFQNPRGGYQPQIGEFEEDTATQNWQLGVQGNYQMPAGEEPNIKVERYSEEERKERILRYLKKRNQRNFNKTIKYACRKTLADRRVRVRGRFARNNELSEEDILAREQSNHSENFIYGGDNSVQFQVIKDDDEGDDWLQKAMASLVYLSHSSPG